MTTAELDYERELVMVILEIIRNLHSGHTLASALFAVGEHNEPALSNAQDLVRGDIGLVAQLVRNGNSLRDALLRWKAHRSSPGVELFVATCLLSMGRGGSLVQSLTVLQSAVTEEIELHDMIRTATAQSTASMVALAMLPVFGTLIFVVVDPSVLGFYFTSPIGLACLVGGVSLVAGGWKFSRVLTRRAMAI